MRRQVGNAYPHLQGWHTVEDAFAYFDAWLTAHGWQPSGPPRIVQRCRRAVLLAPANLRVYHRDRRASELVRLAIWPHGGSLDGFHVVLVTERPSWLKQLHGGLDEAQPKEQRMDDERAIRELIDQWMDAGKAGDTATVLSLMTDDVVFMVPGREPFGKVEFAAASQGMQGVRVDGKAEIRELQVLGGWAYLRSYLRMAITPAGGNTVQRAGYTLTILRKQPDGRWLLARDANPLTAGKT